MKKKMKKILTISLIFLITSSILAVLSPIVDSQATLEQLTTNPYKDRHPSWSPDGTKIAYSAFSGSWHRHIWVMNGDGGGKTQLTSGDVVDEQPAFSPDGTKIAFMRWGFRGDYSDLMLMDADGGNVERLTFSGISGKPEGTYNAPEWSQDGSKLIFMYVEGTTGTPWENRKFWACTMKPDGTDLTAIGRGLYPKFVFEDTKILFNTELPEFKIAIMNADGTNIQHLTDGPADHSPDMAPSSHRIVFTHAPAYRELGDLYVIDADGSNPVPLLTDGQNVEARWSPHEKHIVYTSATSGNWDIWKIEAPPSVRAWKDETSFGLENDHLKLEGDYYHYNHGTPWFNFLLFKDTGTTWTSPWDDIIRCNPNTWYATGSVNVETDMGTEEASITFTYSITDASTTLTWTAEFWITTEPFIRITMHATNTGSQTVDPVLLSLGYYTYIAGDTNSDYYYIPGIGEGQYTGTQQCLDYTPTEPWTAAWDQNKEEGVGVVFTKGYSFPPDYVRIHDWYGLTAVAQGGWGYSETQRLEVGETSQDYQAYLYFFTGTGWQKTKDFYNDLARPPSAPQNLRAEPSFSGVRLTWYTLSDPGNSPIISYNIYRSVGNGEKVRIGEVSEPFADPVVYDDSVVDDNLYYYEIKAVNSGGEGAASDEIKCSRIESIKGVETVLRLDSFETKGVAGFLSNADVFSIQQNFLIPIGAVTSYSHDHFYMMQNVILVVRVSGIGFMSGHMEVWELHGATRNQLGSSFGPWYMLQDTLVMRSTIEGETMVMENNFWTFEFDDLPVDSWINTLSNLHPTVDTSPEIVPVGFAYFKLFGKLIDVVAHVDFDEGTSGHVDSYVRVGSDSGQWLHGRLRVLRNPDRTLTLETSSGLTWNAETGDFNYEAPEYIEQGFSFDPDYESLTTTPPNVPSRPLVSVNSLLFLLHCPANLNIHDSLGQHIGYNATSGSIDVEIPNAFYIFSENEQMIVIFDPLSTYEIQVVGTGDGTYTLEIFWQNETGAVSTVWHSSNDIEHGEIVHFSVFPSVPEPHIVSWEYIFEDAKRGTMLKISIDDQYFQFIARDKTFSIRHDPDMEVCEHCRFTCITMGYEDDEIELWAFALDGRFDFCIAYAKDMQTDKRYLLIDKLGIE